MGPAGASLVRDHVVDGGSPPGGLGQPIADLIAMDGPDAFIARRLILAGTDGFVLSRVSGKYVVRGASIAKIVGTDVLPARAGAYLLED